MRKKRLLFHSDSATWKTGFGRNAKDLLCYLYNTGKYEIFHLCCHNLDDNPDLDRTPWESVGAIPRNQIDLGKWLSAFPQEHRDQKIRDAQYGAFAIDKYVGEIKPDVYIGTQDIWGVDYSVDKPWFSKINSALWVTLDSLPIRAKDIDTAKKCKNFWVWSNFAEKALHKANCPHAKTVHGSINTNFFSPLSEETKAANRAKFGIPEDAFIVGMVSRNQLRKSFPRLIESYKKWRDRYPTKKTLLYFHTSWNDDPNHSWNLPNIIMQYGVDPKEVVTTYICNQCKKYVIGYYQGEAKGCPHCGKPDGLHTTSPNLGVTEDELNEIYNYFDIKVLPITSGGLEYTAFEAKLAGVITAVTNYSCGEELCEPGSFSIPLDWEPYEEPQTQYIKATTKVESIVSAIDKVYKMSPEERKSWKEKARSWVIKGYDVKAIGAKFEEFIDNSPYVMPLVKADNEDEIWNTLVKAELKNPHAPIPPIEDSKLWLKTLYKEILKMEVQDDDSGLMFWLDSLTKGKPRQEIENFFRNEAVKKNIEVQNAKPLGIEDLVDKDDINKRMLYIMPESIGDIFMSTAIFRSLREMYPDYNLYVATKQEYWDVLKGNPHIYKIIPYLQDMDNQIYVEGYGNHEGWFQLTWRPFWAAQRHLDYLQNGHSKVAYSDLRY